MERFAAAGITMNCQIVACPGVNDGPALDRTLRELGRSTRRWAAWRWCRWGDPIPGGPVSDRPVHSGPGRGGAGSGGGICRFFPEKHSTHLAWCSDEFYLLAGRPLPEKGYYEDMPQMENGVGMLRLLTSQAAMALEDMELEEAPPPFAIATGVSAAPFLQKIVDMCREKCGNIIGNVYPMVNRFLGDHHGLWSDYRTGSDRAAQGEALGERLLIPTACSGRGTDLPGRRHCGAGGGGPGVPVTALPADSGFDLVDAILGLPVETPAYALPPEDDYYRYNP